MTDYHTFAVGGWHRPDPATAIQVRTWTDPCPVCGEAVTEVYAEAETVTENPDAVITIPDPACPHGEDPEADCTCTVILNMAPDPARDETVVVGWVYTLRPCLHATREIRFYQQTRPEPGTLGELMADWAGLISP